MVACGLVGLPNVGKSTLFNALIEAILAMASNYPFCTIDPNNALAIVKDPRLQMLSDMSHSKKLVYATMEFVDIAGLVAGASQGEGLGNQFLAHIRETDALIHVVRCFESSDIIHVAGKINPIDDIAIINLELILADLQTAKKIQERIEKQSKLNKEMIPLLNCLNRILAHLDEGKSIRTLSFTKEEKELLKPYPFLTSKKVIYAANVAEEDLPAMDNEFVRAVKEYAAAEGSLVIPICAKIESEIVQLPPEERPEFLLSLGLEESGLQRLVKASFGMLGLITYLTTGEIETRAWTITEGSTAVEAAGKIHSDIQKGFIRAEVVAYEDIVQCGSRVKAREAGKVRIEGRDYIVKDGDVILFMHN